MERKLAQANSLLLEFMINYQRKLAVGFHLNDGIEPKVTPNQLKAMFITKRQGRTLPTELGKSLDMQKGSLTSLLDSLQSLGLIRRERDQDDRRKTWVYLTEAGDTYLQHKMRAYDRYFSALFANVSPAELDSLIISLENVVSVMQQLEEAPKG